MKADPESVLHQRLRFAIASALAAGGPRTFRELRDELGATDGNLGVHALRLEQAGFVESRKSFAGRVPRTEYRLTPEGRRALARYVRGLEHLIEKARGACASPRERSKKRPGGRPESAARGKRSPSRGR